MLLECCYRVDRYQLQSYLRQLIMKGGKEKWVPIRSIDVHVSKQAFLLVCLRKMGIVELKTATRAFTAKETDFVTVPPDFTAVSHVKLSPEWREKALKHGL